MNNEPQNNLLNLSAVLKMFDISKPALYRIKDFPKPIKIGRQNRWYHSALHPYLTHKSSSLEGGRKK